jgi:predicted P-loop ATPase
VGHVDKRPVILPSGMKAARTNTPHSWRPFSDAITFYEKTLSDPRTGVGFVIDRSQGLVFIDFDHCLEDDRVLPWAEPLLAPFLGRTFIERSRSGSGLHVMALGSVAHAHPKLVPEGAQGEEHIELYNHLRYVAVTADVWDGAPVSLTEMQPEIDGLLTALGARSAPDAESDKSPACDDLSPQALAERLEEAQSALGKLDPDVTYDEWLRIGMALHHGLGARGLEVWDQWSAGGAKYNAGECAQHWASFRRSGVTMGTLFHMAKEAGWTSPLDAPERVFEVVGPAPEADADAVPFSSGAYSEWVDGGYQLWKPNPKVESLVPCFSEANLHLFFSRHEDWGDRLRFNIRTQFPEIDTLEVDDHRSYRALAQSHAFLRWEKRAYSVKTVQAVVQAVAEKNSYDPVAEWLRAQQWDGTKRVDRLTEMLGLEDSPFTRRCLKRWLIGVAARALRPGCRFQNMLLLLGPQGRQKSNLLERLAVRKEWFHESHIELQNKEGYITLDRKWIVEFAELDALRKVDVEKVKAFISESNSNYRSPYARKAEDHPRHFGLAGTANQDGVLRDPTGARRFWPVRCPDRIRLDLLTPEVVAQVWAEARTMLENGVRWWDDAIEVDEVNAHNEQFYAMTVSDVMIEKVIEEDFAGAGALRMRALVSRLLELGVIRETTGENAIGTVLRRAGWRDSTARVGPDGAVTRFWFSPQVPVDKRRQVAQRVWEDWQRSIGALAPEPGARA